MFGGLNDRSSTNLPHEQLKLKVKLFISLHRKYNENKKIV